MKFPAFFDKRLVDGADNYDQMGGPKVTPIFIRNVATVFANITGEMRLAPKHQEFILDGGEQPLGEPKNGWVTTEQYALVVNSATWPEAPMSPEGLRALMAVDPALPAKVEAFVATQGQKAAGAKIQAAASQAWKDWNAAQLPSGELGEYTILVPANRPFSEPVLMTKKGLVYQDQGYCYARYVSPDLTKDRFARGSVFYPGVTMRNGEAVLVEFSASCTLPPTTVLPSDELYWERYRQLEATVNAAIAQAESTGLMLDFLSDVKPMEKGYPKPELPVEIHLLAGKRDHKTYDAQCTMLRDLGYEMTKENRSRSGSTVNSSWVLPGKKVDPKKLCQWITRVDFDHGVLYCKKGDKGRLIGSQGAMINRIEDLTEREWRIREE